MANPFAKYAQPQQEEENPFAKYATPQPPAESPKEENPFAKYAPPPAPAPAAPGVTSGPNPFETESVAEAPVEKSNLWEFPKALVRGAINLQGIPAGWQQRQYALSMEAPDSALSAFDKIDAGELKSSKDINKFIGGNKSVKDILSAEELEKGMKPPGAELRAIGIAKDYLKASPEERKKLRAEMQTELQATSQKFSDAVARGEEIKKQAEPYASRLKDFSDISRESPGAFLSDTGTYVASKLGEALPQFGPVLASGLVLKRPGVIGSSIGMELGPATQDRVDFITKQVQNEPDPQKRAASIAKYVRDSADVTLMAATVSGLFDAVLGPEADIAKAMLSGELRKQTRKEILQALPKVVAKNGLEEGLTGALQEVVMINAERKLGEQTGDAFSKENIIRVVDSALSEAIGGLGISASTEGIRAARTKKETVASQDTPEARAMRGLDAIAEEEEARTGNRAKPTARSLDNLTQQEVDAVQRRLFAELGRPAEEQELLEALNGYVAEQNASLGVESEAGGVGVSDTGAEQPAGATGVSDTGTASTSDTGGLGTSGVPSDEFTNRTAEQQAALDEASSTYDQAYEAAAVAWNEYQAAQDEYNALTENTPEDEQAEIYNAYKAARDKWMALSAEETAARENYITLRESLKSPEQIADESTEGIPSEEDVEAARPKSEEVLDEEALFEEQRQGEYQDAINAGYDELDQQEETRQEAPATDVAALEQEERARFNEIKRIDGEKAALLTKAGRAPAKNSPARKKWDALEQQRTEATAEWDAADKRLKAAKTKQETGVDVNQAVNAAAQELFDANPDYGVEEFDAAETKLFQALRSQGVSDKVIKSLYDAFNDRLTELEDQRQQAGGRSLPNIRADESDVSGSSPRRWFSDAFKRWFGDSKAVDANGDPVVIYRGVVGNENIPEGALRGEAREGYASFGSTSPYVASSYGNRDRIFPTMVGAITPLYIKADSLIEFPVTVDRHGSRRFDMFEFDRQARQLKPGQVLVARQVYDSGPRADVSVDPQKLYSYPSDIYAWNNGTSVKPALSEGRSLPNVRVGYSEVDESLADLVPQNQHGVNRINQLWNEGKITYFEYTREMNKLTERLADMRAMRDATRSNLPKEYGFGRVVKAFEDAAKAGRIPAQMADMAIWFLTQNRAMAANLAISIAEPATASDKRDAKLAEAQYNRVRRLMQFFLVREGGGRAFRGFDRRTAVHEILHHLERMLPEKYRAMIRKDWGNRVSHATREAEKALTRAQANLVEQESRLNSTTDPSNFIGSADMLESLRAEVTRQENRLKYLKLVTMANATQNGNMFNEACVMVARGEVPYAFYALMNPSEFWAVNGSNILAGRYDIRDRGRYAQLKQYLKEFVQKVTSVFGMRNDAAIIRGLNAVLHGDGTFQSNQMLSDGINLIFPNVAPGGWGTADTDISEQEQRLNEQVARTGDLHPSVVAAINNNDLNGALRILSKGLNGFMGELATRLAELNLQTSIAIGNGTDVAHRAILATAGPQLQRIASYIRIADPDLYKRRFEGFENSENLVNTSIGITVLNTKNMYPEIAMEIQEVNEAFKKFMSAATAAGAYYNMFDTITLNPDKMKGIGNRVLLHEVVHAATVSLMRADPSQLTPEQLAAREEIKKLFKIAQNNIKTQEYGLRNEFEFLAEVYTNEEFRNLLKGIPYPPASTNILSRFFNAIMRLVGADNLASRAMVEGDKLFTSVRYQGTEPGGPLLAQGKPKKPRGKGPITSSWRYSEKYKEGILKSRPLWQKVSKTVRDRIFDPAYARTRGVMLGALELRHLSDVAGSSFPQIGAMVRIIEKTIEYRGKIMTEAAGIAKDWMAAQKKNVAKSQLLGRVMLEATLNGVEVDPSNTSQYDATKVDQRVKDAWNALGPEFQSIYRRVRDFYKKQMDNTIATLKEKANLIVDPVQRQKILDKIDQDFGPDKLVFPYFPLKRFGPYWFQVNTGRFKEFYEYDSIGERNAALTARKEELARGNKAQQALIEGIEVGDNISTLLSQVSDVSNIINSVNEIVDALPSKFKNLQAHETVEDTLRDTQEELREELNQLLYSMMPEQSMRKQMITRKQVQGASADMLRVFASSATRIAYQQARAKYSSQFIANLNNARDFIKGLGNTRTAEQKRAYRAMLHEMELRYKPMLGMEDTNSAAKAAGIISDTVTTYMMSAPFSALLNTVGFFQFTASQLGGRYGYAKATEQMLHNFSTYMGSSVERTLVPLKNGQMISVHFPSAMESSKLSGLNKVAALQLIGEEQVNVSQTYDMVTIGDRPSELTLSKYDAIKRAVFTPLHQIERFNREIGLLTAFQLEYEKLMSAPRRDSSGIIMRDSNGNPLTFQDDATTPDGVPYSQDAYDLALSYAKNVTAITLGETTRQMRPRYFMNPVAALPLKFKRYMITALFSMWRNLNQGVVQPFKTAEIDQMRKALEANKESPDVIEQKIGEMKEFRKELSREGRKAFAGIMFNTWLAGGVIALPLITTVLPMVLSMFRSEDDDDEFFNWDNWYRNYMESEFGGYLSGLFTSAGMSKGAADKLGSKIGESIVYGPASVISGGSLSERVSIDPKAMAFRDLRYSSTARGTTLEAIASALGPLGGLILQGSDVVDLWGPHLLPSERAVEKMVPAVISKPMSAARYAMEGATTKRGDVIIDDFSAWEISMQAIGLTPHRMAVKQKVAIEAVQKQQQIADRRNSIMNELWMAHSTNNSEDYSAALQKAIDFSVQHPGARISGENITDSLNKRAKDKARAELFGARVERKMYPEIAPMLEEGDR